MEIIKIPKGYKLIKKSETEYAIEKQEIDFSILNEEDWFYIEFADEDEGKWFSKGNIFEQSIDIDIEDFKLYDTSYLTGDKDSVSLLRKATKEEIENIYNKFPQLRPIKSVKSWKELGFVSGFFIGSTSNIIRYGNSPFNSNKNLWPSKEEAEAALALSQLCQLRDYYNDGWKPSWEEDNYKYSIHIFNNNIEKISARSDQRLLSFKSKEIRDKFLENHIDLIEIAKPLL